MGPASNREKTMTIKVAISGYGRIGRCVLRAIVESPRASLFQVVAINDTAGIATTAHLTQFDSTHGRFPKPIRVEGQHLWVGDRQILVISDRDPKNLPWKALDVDLVFECTGHFTDRESASQHLAAGAKKVLISAPGKGVDATIVYGVNENTLRPTDRIVSNASCTTNCVAPVAKVLHEAIGIRSGLLNTIHAYTNDQNLLDSPHRDLQRARAAAHSIIPTKTGAAEAVGLVLPDLIGKLNGFAMRVPVMNVSVIDLSFISMRPTSVEEVNAVMARAQSEVLKYNTLPLVSTDFNHEHASAVFDSTQTKVLGDLVKVVAWYDNEWGFSNRMLDVACCMMGEITC